MATKNPTGYPVFKAFHPSTYVPLNGGKLYTYEPGTSTWKKAYKDNTASPTAWSTNPIILDGNGEAKIYWDGEYDLELYDADNNLLWTLDGFNKLSADTSSPLGDNQLPNPSFEVGGSSPDEWTITEYTGGTFTWVSGDSGDAEYDSAFADGTPEAGLHGKRGLKFNHPGGASNGGGYAQTTNFISVDENNSWHMAFDTKVAATGARNLIEVYWYNAEQTQLISGGTTTVYDTTTGPTTATRYYYTFNPPAGARFAKVRITGGLNTTDPGGSRDAYFDNFYWKQYNDGVIQATDSSGSSILVFNTVTGGALTERMRIAADGTVGIGINDTANGSLYLYGDSGANSGELRLYNSVDGDGVVDYWSLNSGASGNLNINNNTGTIGYITTASVFNWSAGTMVIGSNDTTKGSLYLYGDSNVAGGELRIYNAANEDITIDYYSITANNDLEFTLDGIVKGYLGSDGSFNWSSGTAIIGSNDTTKGSLYLYGDSGANSGELRLYNGLTADTTADYWSITSNDTTLSIDHSGTTGNTALVTVGANDDTTGALYLYGDNTNDGGELRLYNSANEDTTVDYYSITANDDLEFTIGGAPKITMANDGGLVVGTTASSQGVGTASADAYYIANRRLGVWQHFGNVTISTDTDYATFATELASGADEYLIVIHYAVPTTDGTDFNLRITDDSGTTYESTAYSYTHLWASSTPSSGAVGSGSASAITLANTVGNASGENIRGEIRIRNPNQSTRNNNITYNFGCEQAAGNTYYTTGTGTRTTLTSWTGLRLFFGTYGANQISAADIDIYGLVAGA